jgi:hypothetical protein
MGGIAVQGATKIEARGATDMLTGSMANDILVLLKLKQRWAECKAPVDCQHVGEGWNWKKGDGLGDLRGWTDLELDDCDLREIAVDGIKVDEETGRVTMIGLSDMGLTGAQR